VIILSISVLCEMLWMDCSLAREVVPFIDSMEKNSEPKKPNRENKNLGSGGLVTKKTSAEKFDGEWEKPSLASSGTFSISLKQKDSKITGQYCAITKNGHRIDCDTENNPNITGDVDGRSGSANLTFSSFFGATTGKATIALRHGQLIWHIREIPRGGESYAPLDAILLKN
jgi:hypothetical protein